MNLLWKCLPLCTLGGKDRNPGNLGDAKDRISLTFRASAAGDKMISPLLLYEDPKFRLFYEKRYAFLFFWRSLILSLTATLILDWLHNCFILWAWNYLTPPNFAFRVLLIVFPITQTHFSLLIRRLLLCFFVWKALAIFSLWIRV